MLQKKQTALTLVPRRSDGSLVEENTPEFFRAMCTEELQEHIGGMLKAVEGHLGRVNKEVRGPLIEALQELKQRIPYGLWEDFLTEHKLNPSTVRSWLYRAGLDASRLCLLLGEQLPRRKRKEKADEVGEAMRLAQAGKRLAQEIVRGHIPYAKKLAEAYLERCKSMG